MLNDLYYAFRQLVKSPAFTIVSILTIALGIGTNTAVFSVMNAVLLRLLPVPNPQQLVLFHLKNQTLRTSQSGYDDTSLSMPVFEAMRTRHDVFTDVVAFAPLAFGKVPVRFGAEPEQVHGEIVSGNFFSGLGVEPLLGRGFTLQDEAHSTPVAILSYGWWNRRFNASRNILGQTLYVKSIAFTIIGVASPGFEGTDPGQPNMDFWIPMQRNPALNPWGEPPGDKTLYGSPDFLCLLMIGRLRPEVSPQRASAALTPLFRRTLAQASPVNPKDRKPELVFSDVRGIGTLRDDYEHPLHVLMTMVGLVLLIACANVAMLLLLRNAAKQREFALRRALGANARVLFGQLFSESFLMVTAGCALAWVFAGAATGALTRWSGLDFIIKPDGQVLLFTIAISAVVALAFGLVPMRVVNSLPLALTLRSSGAASNTERRRFSGRKVVVALQISLCAVLLFAGELLYASLRNLESSNLGMRTAGVLVFGITPQSDIRTDAQAIRLHLRILQALRALPGVDCATISAVRLGSGGSSNDGVLVDGQNPLPAKPYAPMRVNEVGSDFLRTLGIPLHLGRDIDEADIHGSNKIAIVDQTFADRYLPKTNPLGHQIALLESPRVTYTIVGVSRTSRYTGVREPERPVAYLPFTQVSGVSEMQYEIHTFGDPNAILPEATKAVHRIDANLPLEGPITQREQFERTISQERLIARLSVFFGGLAMFLVLIGLYGTISYSMRARSTEIGVRMALGAQRYEVLGMVLRESALLAVFGLAIGLPLAFALARALRSMLFGLSSADPIACIAALTGIALITAGATFLPAQRAATIDPIRALRME
ncbi:MAG: ABC transporter permease [Bryobacteraceae bacterium]